MDEDEPRISLPVEPQVSYSVKEILARIEGKMDDFLKALTLKADEAVVQGLRDRVDRTEDRIDELERERKARESQSKWRTEWQRWLVPTLLTAAYTAATLYALIHH